MPKDNPGKTDADTHGRDTQPAATLLFGALVWAVIILVFAWFRPGGREFITRWWLFLAAGGAVLVVICLIPSVRQRFKTATTATQTGVIVFALLPALLMAIGAIVLLSPKMQILVLRSIFLIIVCLLPALIYYLFIATRKISLLNDYFVNLSRLGLLEPRCSAGASAASIEEAHTECRVRRLNYMQKFEALYGPLPPTLQTEIMKADNALTVLANATSRPTASGIAQVFTAETAIPVVIATVLIALGWLLALPPVPAVPFGPELVVSSGFWSSAFWVNEHPITYAFLGAYFFSLQMLFRRYVREDLRKTAYVAVSLRILLALIGTWAVVTGLKATGKVESDSLSLVVLGFVIGVFPRVAWQFIQGLTKKIMTTFNISAVLPSLESRLPVSDLEGLTVWHESRLEEQDIENIPNMASAEIVDLMISTRFSPDRIIDWVDQAILYTHLGPPQNDSDKVPSRREKLRLQGICTATALIQAFDKAQSRQDADEVKTILTEASGSHIRSFVDTLQTEPNLGLICAWRGIEHGTPHADAVDARPTPSTRANP